jgi:aspartate ammonia-lyase
MQALRTPLWLKKLAVTLSKISSDLIFLASGPRNGIFEINLPALQPGSSIMPGKVNPVMPELMNQVCYKVMGTMQQLIASRMVFCSSMPTTGGGYLHHGITGAFL